MSKKNLVQRCDLYNAKQSISFEIWDIQVGRNSGKGFIVLSEALGQKFPSHFCL